MSAGAVYVFRRTGPTWIQDADMKVIEYDVVPEPLPDPTSR
jgi:hypothetical protein